MRIFAIALLLGSAVLAANPLTPEFESTAGESRQSGTVVAAGENIDPKGSSKVVGTIDQFEEFIAKYEKVTEISGQ